MRRAKPISVRPVASWKHRNPFKLRQIPALCRDLTTGRPGQSKGVRQEITSCRLVILGLIVMASIGRVADRSNRVSYSLSKLAPTLRKQ